MASWRDSFVKTMTSCLIRTVRVEQRFYLYVVVEDDIKSKRCWDGVEMNFRPPIELTTRSDRSRTAPGRCAEIQNIRMGVYCFHIWQGIRMMSTSTSHAERALNSQLRRRLVWMK